MADQFRSLASLFALRVAENAEPATQAEAAVATEASEQREVSAPPASPEGREMTFADERVMDLLDAFVADLARLRARATERLEEEVEAVLDDLAERVLARELLLGACDIRALVDEAMATFGTRLEQVAVRVSLADARRLSERWPLEIDANLRPGDFALGLEDGTFDASLQTRLEAMLASHRVAL